MNIHNIRLGFANNSSSTHSLIFLKDVKDYDVENEEFGWNYFTCASEESKTDYLYQLLRLNLQKICGNEAGSIIANNWLGTSKIPKQGKNSYLQDGYIDHQSLYTLPLSWDEKLVDQEFFNNLKDYILQKDLVILGGNDNDEKPHPLDKGNKSFILKLERDDYNNKWVCRKDKNYWSLFNRTNGAKLRLSFNLKDDVQPTKSNYPELVDLKITDFCPYNCSFCYTDSTIKGKEAEYYNIYRVLNILSEMKVFEVAIGGGEPTTHKNFIAIIKDCRNVGIIPNFTTYNIGWLNNPKMWIPITDNCGSFAYSVNDDIKTLTIDNIYEKLTENGIEDKIKVSIQCIIGVCKTNTIETIIKKCIDYNFSLTLLGYKETGRGNQYIERENNSIEIFNLIKKLKYKPNISIDTALAKEWEPLLKESKIPRQMYHLEEGKFSCYIDAVNKKIGPSSYCNEKEYKYLSKDWGWDNEILEAYSQF